MLIFFILFLKIVFIVDFNFFIVDFNFFNMTNNSHQIIPHMIPYSSHLYDDVPCADMAWRLGGRAGAQLRHDHHAVGVAGVRPGQAVAGHAEAVRRRPALLQAHAEHTVGPRG